MTHTDDEFPLRCLAAVRKPVWMDIRQSDTLQKNSAREEKDERHICPLQLEVIRRCIELWTNPGISCLNLSAVSAACRMWRGHSADVR